MNWLIIYSDGSTYSNQDGAWLDAPSWDVQVVVEPNETAGRVFHTRKDYYLQIDGAIVPVDFTGLLDYLANVLGIVKVGRMLPNDDYRELIAQAMTADGFPKKSAWLPDEPRPRNE